MIVKAGSRGLLGVQRRKAVVRSRVRWESEEEMPSKTESWLDFDSGRNRKTWEDVEE